MTETAVAVAQGNGVGTELQMLISMVGRLGEIGATMKSVEANLTELRTNTTQQLAHLQERVGRSEALNEVQNERIKQAEQSDVTFRADLLEMKAAHAKEIAALKVKHDQEMLELRNEIRESTRLRWMIRGGLAVLAVGWPILWNLVVLPLVGR